MICVKYLDGMKHRTKIVRQWSQVIVRMSNLVTIIDDHVDKLRLLRRNSKPNERLAEGKITILVMIVILTTTPKGVCGSIWSFMVEISRFIHCNSVFS